MSIPAPQLVFVCSFCAQAIRLTPQQVGLRVQCPACKRVVVLLPNQNEVIDERLTTYWTYRQPRLFLSDKEVGPMIDTELLSLIRRGNIGSDTEVRSPQATRNQWVTIAQVNMAVIQERVDQRIAEGLRREQLIERQRVVNKANRDKLRGAIRNFVEDGVFTAAENQAVQQFAVTAGIPANEVQQLLAEESTKLVREVFDEAVSDGILDSSEEQRIGKLAASLGVTLKLNEEDNRRINLCHLAHEINTGRFVPDLRETPPIKLAAKEIVYASADITWHEVVSTKRDAVALGDGNFLKRIGAGTAYLTNKQVIMLGALDSKKITLASVQRVSRYSDGIFFNRSSGKSVFLAIDSRSIAGGRFGLITESACTNQPVLGFDSTARFIPDAMDAQIEEFDFVEIVGGADRPFRGGAEPPRYTFRVVGDHIGNRASHISRLRPSYPLLMLREPTNPVDYNAVAVYDQGRNQLGYLKREVAEWFGPILDRGKRYTASVHTLTSNGSLIVAVHE